MIHNMTLDQHCDNKGLLYFVYVSTPSYILRMHDSKQHSFSLSSLGRTVDPAVLQLLFI